MMMMVMIIIMIMITIMIMIINNNSVLVHSTCEEALYMDIELDFTNLSCDEGIIMLVVFILVYFSGYT